MSHYLLTCTYCNHSWKSPLYYKQYTKCPKCDDAKIKAEDIGQKINYYEGAPAFEEKKEPTPIKDNSMDSKGSEDYNDPFRWD